MDGKERDGWGGERGRDDEFVFLVSSAAEKLRCLSLSCLFAWRARARSRAARCSGTAFPTLWSSLCRALFSGTPWREGEEKGARRVGFLPSSRPRLPPGFFLPRRPRVSLPRSLSNSLTALAKYLLNQPTKHNSDPLRQRPVRRRRRPRRWRRRRHGRRVRTKKRSEREREEGATFFFFSETVEQSTHFFLFTPESKIVPPLPFLPLSFSSNRGGGGGGWGGGCVAPSPCAVECCSETQGEEKNF